MYSELQAVISFYRMVEIVEAIVILLVATSRLKCEIQLS
jgi:hypothetical protein